MPTTSADGRFEVFETQQISGTVDLYLRDLQTGEVTFIAGGRPLLEEYPLQFALTPNGPPNLIFVVKNSESARLGSDIIFFDAGGVIHLIPSFSVAQFHVAGDAIHVVVDDASERPTFKLDLTRVGSQFVGTLEIDGAVVTSSPIYLLGRSDSLGVGLAAPTISADGRFVAFQSQTDGLVPGDVNGVSDVFVADMLTGTKTLVSVGEGGHGNAASFAPSMSDDGRYVTFQSLATNLVPGDTNGAADTFVRDMLAGTTALVSTGFVIGGTATATLSADGRSINLDGDLDGNGTLDHVVVDNPLWVTPAAPTINSNGGGAIAVIEIAENQQHVTTVSVADAPAAAGVSYTIVGGADASEFALNSSTGALSFVSAPNFEAPVNADNVYNVVVQAANAAGEIDTQALAIHVNNVAETPSVIERVSVAGDGLAGNAPSENVSSGLQNFSADGRYVAFWSVANDLVAGDTNNSADIFVKDLQTGVTTRASLNSAGQEGNGHSFGPSISADGRYVLFQSDASNLVSGDTNGQADIFLRDLLTGTTTLVSPAVGGGSAHGSSLAPAISADGRYAVFESDADNLVSGDGNGVSDIFVRDLQGGTTTRLSDSSTGSFAPALSADGRTVVFETSFGLFLSDLTTGATTPIVNGATVHIIDALTHSNVFMGADPGGGVDNTGVEFAIKGTPSARLASDIIWSPPEGSPRLVSAFTVAQYEATEHKISLAFDDASENSAQQFTAVSFGHGGYLAQMIDVTAGALSSSTLLMRERGEALPTTFAPSISADGRFLAFQSGLDVFVRDLPTGTLTRASSAIDGQQADGYSTNPSISGDGRFVVFESNADNLVSGDTNQASDIFVRDLQTGNITLVSTASLGQANAASHTPTISPDGRTISFVSDASNLAEGDAAGGVRDVFVTANPLLPANPAPGLSVDKVVTGVFNADNSVDSDGKVDAVGDYITYGITVSNSGNTSLTGIRVSDPLASGLTFTGGDGDQDNSLGVTEVWTYSARYTATQSDIAVYGNGNSSNSGDVQYEVFVYSATIANTISLIPLSQEFSTGNLTVNPSITRTPIAMSQAAALSIVPTVFTVYAIVEIANNDTNFVHLTDAELQVAANGTTNGVLGPSIAEPFVLPRGIPNIVFVSSDQTGIVADATSTPVNSNVSPTITSNGGQESAAVDAPENSAFVTVLTATDNDLPAQPLTFTITGGEDASLFVLYRSGSLPGPVSADPNAYELYFRGNPNFEALPAAGAQPGYQVTVQVSDGNGGIDTQEITVNVTDVAEPKLAVDKVVTGVFNADNTPDSDGKVDAQGDYITYAVNVRNTGDTTLTGVSVNDSLLGTLATGVTLAPGATNTYTGSYSATQDDLDNNGNLGNGFTSDTIYEVIVQDPTGTFNTSLGITADGRLTNQISQIQKVVAVSSLAALNIGNTIFAVTQVLASSRAGDPSDHTIVHLSDAQVQGAINNDPGLFVSPPPLLWDGIGNFATVDSDQTGPVSDQVSVPVTQVHALAVDKVVTGVFNADNTPDSDGKVDAVGDYITYGVNVSNAGNVTLTGVSVVDPLLGVLSAPTGDTDHNSALDVTETWTYTASYTVTQAVLDNNGTGNTGLSLSTPYVALVLDASATKVVPLGLSIIGSALANDSDIAQRPIAMTQAAAQSIVPMIAGLVAVVPAALLANFYQTSFVNLTDAEVQTKVNQGGTIGGSPPTPEYISQVLGGAAGIQAKIDALLFSPSHPTVIGGLAGVGSIVNYAIADSDQTNAVFATANVSVAIANQAPSITSSGGGATAAASIAENTTLVTTLIATDFDLPAQTLTFSISGEDATLFEIRNGNELHFRTAPNFEALPGQGATPGYQINIQVSDGHGGIDTQAIAVTVTNASEPTNGGNTLNFVVNGTGNSQTVKLTDTAITDGDLVTAANPTGTASPTYQWQFSNNGGTTWTNIAGATAVNYTPTGANVDRPVHVVATYTDAFGVHTVTSQAAEIGDSNANTLQGTAGADLLIGLNGNDTYTVNDAGDRVIEATGGGDNDL